MIYCAINLIYDASQGGGGENLTPTGASDASLSKRDGHMWPGGRTTWCARGADRRVPRIAV